MLTLKHDPAYDPLEHLDQLKARLVRHTLQEHNAVWVPERRMVIVDRGLRSDLVRPTLAHECVHVENDDCSGHHPRHEARANLHSALRLTDPDAWDLLTSTYSDFDHICIELGITRRQFRAFYEHRQLQAKRKLRLERIGDTVYLDPKLGAGQWAMKVSA